MPIKKSELAWIVVSDLTKSKKFFTDIGLKVTNSAEEYNWLELAGSQGGTALGVGKMSKEQPDKPGQNAVMTFTVDDIVAAKKDMETKGVKFVDEIMEVPGHVKMVSFVDPDNNKFQLVQNLN